MAARLFVRLGTRLLRAKRAARRLIKRLGGRRIRIHIENRWRLGDEIMAIPFYELVRERFPKAEITVSVTYPELLGGLADILVDNTRSEFDCDRHIRARNDARSVPRLERLCSLHDIPYRHLEPVVSPPSEAKLPEPLPNTDLRVACSCGAGWVCKSLPTAFLRELCAHLSLMLPDVGFVEVGRGCPSVGVGVCYVDRLSVAKTANVLANCSLYVGPDSGLAHLAMAVGTPALVFYGPVKPDRAFGPRHCLRAVLSPVECQGCWTDGRMTEPGACALGIRSMAPVDYPCMRALTPELAMRGIAVSGLRTFRRDHSETYAEAQ